jgi:hypothetical protein
VASKLHSDDRRSVTDSVTTGPPWTVHIGRRCHAPALRVGAARVVLDAAVSKRAVLIGVVDAAAAALGTAARYPERVESVIAADRYGAAARPEATHPCRRRSWALPPQSTWFSESVLLSAAVAAPF